MIDLALLVLAGATVTEMRLCESERVVLKPDQLYYFTVDPNCIHCVRLFEKGLQNARPQQ